MEYKWKPTQSKSWTRARLPRVAAKCNGVRRSRMATLQLTSSGPARAKIRATVFKSERHTASISCWPRGADWEGMARNSLCSYLARIQRSLSSRLDCGLGFTPLILASQMLLLTVLPRPSITAMCPGLLIIENDINELLFELRFSELMN